VILAVSTLWLAVRTPSGSYFPHGIIRDRIFWTDEKQTAFSSLFPLTGVYHVAREDGDLLKLNLGSRWAVPTSPKIQTLVLRIHRNDRVGPWSSIVRHDEKFEYR
jgi:hypothetical protein